ncbi:unnamed protein product [Mytilus coruscus]|uniref:Uncharacterized protein n=1 Tax=Mytilus coruscus TaxID=42192 RepID=A0A6J8CUQ8_MYTCO|nr:unnamed protein product [Mytilus coruscus]
MTDPFDIDAHPPCLINISTGMHATREVQDSLLFAVDEGENMCRKFVKSALSLDQSGSFYSPITKSKLKTFEHMNAKTTLKCKSGEIITGHINPEIVFRRALVLANSRDDVTIESILSLPLGPIPVSLFHEDGTMRKCCKSDLSSSCRAHALSGCDTTSSLFGIGKKSVYKVLKDAVLDFSDLYNLGDSDRDCHIMLQTVCGKTLRPKEEMLPAIRTLTNWRVKLATTRFKSGQIATL